MNPIQIIFIGLALLLVLFVYLARKRARQGFNLSKEERKTRKRLGV